MPNNAAARAALHFIIRILVGNVVKGALPYQDGSVGIIASYAPMRAFPCF
jgi:hypothetical protein